MLASGKRIKAETRTTFEVAPTPAVAASKMMKNPKPTGGMKKKVPKEKKDITNSPPGAVNRMALTMVTPNDPLTCEKVLNDAAISLKKLIMMHHAGEMSHDIAAVEYHVSDRAKEMIDKELARIGNRLVVLQGPNPSHKTTAYSQLWKQILEDTENIIFSLDRRQGDLLKLEFAQRKEESERMQHMLAQELAAREQTVVSLVSDRGELEAQVRALQRSNESLKHELGKVLQEQTHTHQHAVELRMQGLDYKAEVEGRCERVLNSVHSRMGFIPAGIMKNIQHLRTLKAPGDPAYDAVRRFAYAKAATEAKGVSTKSKRAIDSEPEVEEQSEETENENYNGDESSPSVGASGVRVSRWAEMIYKADGLGAGWSGKEVEGEGEGDSEYDEQREEEKDEQLWGAPRASRSAGSPSRVKSPPKSPARAAIRS